MKNEEQVSMLDFIKAWETSVKDNSGVQGCADKTGLTPDTCQARASKYRNPEFKQVPKRDADGKIVYRRNVKGEAGEVETTDKTLAKKNKQGKPIAVKVFAKDAKGEKILVRRAIGLSTMPRGGHSRLVNQLDEADALIASLRGDAAIA